jgi:hypothetical protein
MRPREDALQPKINNSQHGATLHSRSKDVLLTGGNVGCQLAHI